MAGGLCPCWRSRREAGSDRWLVKNTLGAALWAETARREVVRVGASKRSTSAGN